MRIYRLGKRLIGILSCLIILATLPTFSQNEINKRPLQDFASDLQNKLDNKEVDLDKPFSVTLNGYLTEEGKFDVKRSKFTKSEGDIQMVVVAKKAIEALGDSGLFSYFSDLEVEKVLITLSQNEKESFVVINSELPNVEKAKTIASGFNVLFSFAKLKVKEEDIKVILNATNISTQDKNCIINLVLPKEEAHLLLKKRLQEVKEKSYSSKGELKR